MFILLRDHSAFYGVCKITMLLQQCMYAWMEQRCACAAEKRDRCSSHHYSLKPRGGKNCTGGMRSLKEKETRLLRAKR